MLGCCAIEEEEEEFRTIALYTKVVMSCILPLVSCFLHPCEARVEIAFPVRLVAWKN
jgi:hypothetical protein